MRTESVGLRILQTCPVPYPAFHAGGVTRAVHNLSTELSARGHSVEVWSSRLPNDAKEPEGKLCEEPQYRLLKFDAIWAYRGGRIRFYPTPKLGLIARKRVGEFDIVHLHEPRAFQTLVVAHEARRAGIPYVVSTHGGLSKSAEWRNLKDIFDFLFLPEILDGATACHALTGSEAALLCSKGVPQSRITMIPNVLGPLRPGSRERFRRAHTISRDAPVIVYLGRLHRRKGLDLLLAAFETISRRRDAYLVVAGIDDGYGEEFVQLVRQSSARDRCLFLGAVSEETRFDLLAAADAFVLVSIGEGLPMSVLEAAAAGIPIVYSEEIELTGLSEMGGGIKTGRNLESLAASLEEVLGDENERSAMGERSRRWVSQHHGDEIVARYEEFYRRASDRPLTVTKRGGANDS